MALQKFGFLWKENIYSKAKIMPFFFFQPEDKSIVVGMTNNILNIKHRKNPEESKEATGQQRRHPSYRVFVKGKNYVPKQVSECCGCDQQTDSRCDVLLVTKRQKNKMQLKPPLVCCFSLRIVGLFAFSCFFSLLTTFLQDDFLVSKPVKQHLAKYDKQLKKFNVSKALDTALKVGSLCFYSDLV